MKNTGKGYEALTEQVFKQLHAQSGVDVDVRRDILLQGKSTTHQLDVTFEFNLGTTKYRTIIQCKDWKSPVKQEQVFAFHGVLADIPGQPRGIMVSRSGFQSGARDYAEKHGIELYELREPRDEDYVGVLRAIETEIRIRVPTFENVSFILDEAWLREQLALLNIPTMEFQHHFDPRFNEAFSESGEPYDLIYGLNSEVPKELCEGLAISHMFPTPLFVNAPGCPLSKLKVLGMKAEVTLREDSEPPSVVSVSMDDFVEYCFRDVVQGKNRFLDRDGNKVGGPP